MKSSLFLLIALCLPLVAHTEDEHDHKHCDHDHGKHVSAEPSNSAESWLKQLSLEAHMVENRIIRGKDVIAVPLGAIINDAGRNYILALSGDDGSRLEKWEVELGVADSEFIEAKRGVFPGDYIAVSERRLAGREDSVPSPEFTNNPFYYSPEQNRNGIRQDQFTPNTAPSPPGLLNGQTRADCDCPMCRQQRESFSYFAPNLDHSGCAICEEQNVQSTYPCKECRQGRDASSFSAPGCGSPGCSICDQQNVKSECSCPECQEEEISWQRQGGFRQFENDCGPSCNPSYGSSHRHY